MNHTIFTTRNTSKGRFVQNMIGVAISTIFLYWCAMRMAKTADELERLWRFSEAESVGTSAIMLIVVATVSAVLETLYHMMHFKSHADVYQDRIVGKGIQKIALQDFDLRLDQIVDISQTKGFLNVGKDKNTFLVINTASGGYKISTTVDCASQIMEFYRKNKL